MKLIWEWIVHTRVTLADDWRVCWRYGSVWWPIICGGLWSLLPELINTYTNLSPELKASLPHGTGQMVVAASFLLPILGRMTKREDKRDVGNST